MNPPRFSRWLGIVGYAVGGVIVGAGAGWLVAQQLADPVAIMSTIEVGAVLGGVLSAVWYVSASR